MTQQIFNARKIHRINGTGNFFKERMQIKAFKTRQEMDEFLNGQDNSWREYIPGNLKAGTYAFAGGQWHNTKTLDASLLAHI